jgi:mRNA interferase YafQ
VRRIERSTAFKRDYRKVKAISHYRDLDERLVAVLELLIKDHPLPPRNRDHALSGNRSGYRDCHLWPDLLLIYAKPSPEPIAARPYADLMQFLK